MLNLMEQSVWKTGGACGQLMHGVCTRYHSRHSHNLTATLADLVLDELPQSMQCADIGIGDFSRRGRDWRRRAKQMDVRTQFMVPNYFSSNE